MNYNEERLKALFSAYGNIESCKLMIDKSTSMALLPFPSRQTAHLTFLEMSLGYGFVKYSDPDSSAKAIEMLNGS